MGIFSWLFGFVDEGAAQRRDMAEQARRFMSQGEKSEDQRRYEDAVRNFYPDENQRRYE